MSKAYIKKRIIVFKAVGCLLQLAFSFFIFQKTILAAPLPIAHFTKAQDPSQKSKETKTANKPIAFVNVNLIPMDREIVIPNQTVIIRGDRIEAIGPSKTISIPPGTMIINAAGKYLVPGLVDTHVHLARDQGGRPDFGDAPLFLSYGITTVFNLRGTPEQLTWKDKILQDHWSTPNLYTCGDYINEPRITTPEEVEKEISKQVRAGYDMIKFREIGLFNVPFTKNGLSKTTYSHMAETAARLNIPLIGHAPHNLGYQALLDAHQSLAHVSELVNLYFFPRKYERFFYLMFTLSYSFILLIIVFFSIIKLIGKLWKYTTQIDSKCLHQIYWIAVLLVLIGFFDDACFSTLIKGSPISGNRWPSILFYIFSGLIVLGSARIIILTRRLLQKPPVFVFTKISCIFLSLAVIAFSLTLTCRGFLSWRHSASGLEKLSQQCYDANIWVQSTLLCDENFSRMNKHEIPQLLQDPELRYIPFKIKKMWEYCDKSYYAGYDASFFKMCQDTIGALHRADVPIMVGTDANGGPFVIPGPSLHRELQLLHECGLTPYEVLQTATIRPAQFLKKQDEFGTIAVGKRADLLLLDGNPLVYMGHLKQPFGVMVRGKWLSREQLNRMLVSL